MNQLCVDLATGRSAVFPLGSEPLFLGAKDGALEPAAEEEATVLIVPWPAGGAFTRIVMAADGARVYVDGEPLVAGIGRLEVGSTLRVGRVQAVYARSAATEPEPCPPALAGRRCPVCHDALQEGDPVWRCPECGCAVHAGALADGTAVLDCWEEAEGCLNCGYREGRV